MATRLIMLLVVSGGAVAAFLSSVVLLWMGLRYMPVRYALAGLAGYGVFLTLMIHWLGRHTRSALVDRAGDVVNSFDIPGEVVRGGSRLAKRTSDGLFSGGRSGGGGASAAFDSGAPPPGNPAPLMMSTSSTSGSSKRFSLDFDDADDALPLLAVIAVIAALAACVSVIWQAPQMLGELLADGAVAGAAYKGLRTSTGDWTLGVIRRTWIPAAAVLVIFVLLGFAGHQMKPGADSIGDFFR